VVVIPNAYIPSPASAGRDIRTELGLADGDLVVAIAALLRTEKRIDLLLDAHRQVREALPQAHLVIAGDGECRADLERRSHDLGLDGAVHFLGARTDVDNLLRSADVGALSSDREGSPLLVFECMANGTPLVATSVGGVPDVIQDNRTGVLVPRRDPGAMARGLIGLLSDPARRSAMAAAAGDALRRYTIDAVAGRFADLYDTLIG
jgi:glycosyltransferase involved in cell wall biosynthesis